MLNRTKEITAPELHKYQRKTAMDCLPPYHCLCYAPHSV